MRCEETSHPKFRKGMRERLLCCGEEGSTGGGQLPSKKSDVARQRIVKYQSVDDVLEKRQFLWSDCHRGILRKVRNSECERRLLMINFVKSVFVRAVIFFVFLSGIAFLTEGHCSVDNEKNHLVFSVQKSVYNSLIYIAIANGYWKDKGIDVKIKEFPVGRLCLESVLTGNADLAAVSDFPVALAGLNKQQFFIISTIAWGDGDVKVVARKDKGVEQPRDLIGKNIATFLGTAPEFYLRQFLEKNGIKTKEVHIINMRPQDMVAGLVRGDIQASVLWEPFAFHAQQQLGESAVLFNEKGFYKIAHTVVASKKFVLKNHFVVNKVVSGLLEAEFFAEGHQKEAIQIVANATELSPDILEKIWDNYEFKVALKKNLSDQLYRIAKWSIETNIMSEDLDVPNYINFFYSNSFNFIDKTTDCF